MTYHTVSRNPVFRAGPKSLLELRTAIEQVSSLSNRQRADLISAINTVGRLHLRSGEADDDAGVRQSLARLPVSPQLLRNYLRRADAARLGLKKGSWANIRSRLNKCLHLGGVRVREGNRLLKLTPAWRALTERIGPRYELIAIKGFIHWCITEGIAPHDVDQEMFERYNAHLAECDLRLHARQTYLATCRVWNWARKIEGWPQFTIAPKLRRKWYALRFSDFGEGFEADVEAYLREATRFPRHSGRRPIRPATAKHHHSNIRRMASALVHSGVCEAKSIHAVADLLTLQAAHAILGFLLDRAAARSPQKQITTTTDIFSCANLLCALASRWARVPEDHVLQLRELARSLKPAQRGMTKKNRRTLRVFEDAALVARYLDLPEKLFGGLLNKRKLTTFEAVKAQIATAIAILSIAPIRPGNLSRLVLGESLLELGNGKDRRLQIYFPGEEVKNATDINFELSGVVLGLVDTYIRQVRPLLTHAGNRFLFPGRGDRHKHPAHLSTQIANLVEAELGIRLTAQQFRHLAGYLYLVAHPGEYETVRQFLGHNRLSTTMNFYVGMERKVAVKAWGDFVSQRRRELQQSHPRRRTRRS